METFKPLALSNNALKVLSTRYLLHRDGLVETPEELFRRVAKAVASAELKWNTKDTAKKWEDRFFDVMTDLLFLPNSPTLMNAGTPLNQLSACFVLPVADSLEEIFTTLKQAALVQQSGGGTGFNFSHLRPKDDPLSITNGTASGPISFMKVFNAATEHIKHGGKRRGANMGILNVNHPDIEAFIISKKDESALNNFNISVGITDDFMQAVEANRNWDLINPKTGALVKTIKARTIWENIVINAWLSGDPGLIFLDTINEDNPLPELGIIDATNPCGEVPLLPYEACNLGSINLSKFVNRNKTIDWEKLGVTIDTAVRFLDNVIEKSNFIIHETEIIAHRNRKIGLGVMGWADLLVQHEIPYDCEAALALAECIMQFIEERSMQASEELAKERGSFPNWNQSIFSPNKKIRNATRLSIAPTGTISIIADTSSSIEPLFALAYERRHVLDGSSLPEINGYFLDYLKEHDLYTPALIVQVKKTGNLATIHSLPDETKALFKTAHEIAPEWHLKHQVTFQKYIDNAVSKTINLPTSATIEDVAHIYKTAWQQKAKGITVFRYHSKEKQVLEFGISNDIKACTVCNT